MCLGLVFPTPPLPLENRSLACVYAYSVYIPLSFGVGEKREGEKKGEKGRKYTASKGEKS